MKKQLINLEPVREQVKQKLIEKYDTTIFMNTSTVDIKLDIKEILDEYIEAKQLTVPTIYITSDAYVKMRKLVDDTTTEIGWYGTVTKCPGLDNVYVIEDILVYPQTVSGATCVQDDDKIFEFELSLTTEQVNHKRFHGHSHVNMGVTPSGVDEQFYQDILTQVTDYFIITITNKRDEYTVRFYDMENNILYSDLPIQVLTSNGIKLDLWYEEEIKKLNENKPVISSSITDKIPGKDSKVCHSAFIGRADYDFDEDEFDRKYGMDTDPMIWHDDYGYIRRSELTDIYRKKKKAKKGKR